MSREFAVSRVLWAALTLLAPWLAFGCGSRATGPQPSPTPANIRGITLTPRSFDEDDYLEFWDLAKQTGGVVAWYGDWIELAGAEFGAAGAVSRQSVSRGLTPVIGVQFFRQATGELLRPLDAATRAIYRDTAAGFAASFKPPFFALGLEVNILYERARADFEDFVEFYPEVYDAVKAASPGTKVFPIFQLEKMQGMGGGLFGGVNDTSRAEWFLLELFPKSDLAAFTTYPGLVFGEPASIPGDYYAAIRHHTTREVAFTEVGWHAAASPPGWESSGGEQAAAVDTFLARTVPLSPSLSIWSFLFDQAAPEPFGSMGLRTYDRTARPSWGRWIVPINLSM